MEQQQPSLDKLTAKILNKISSFVHIHPCVVLDKETTRVESKDSVSFNVKVQHALSCEYYPVTITVRLKNGNFFYSFEYCGLKSLEVCNIDEVFEEVFKLINDTNVTYITNKRGLLVVHPHVPMVTYNEDDGNYIDCANGSVIDKESIVLINEEEVPIVSDLYINKREDGTYYKVGRFGLEYMFSSDDKMKESLDYVRSNSLMVTKDRFPSLFDYLVNGEVGQYLEYGDFRWILPNLLDFRNVDARIKQLLTYLGNFLFHEGDDKRVKSLLSTYFDVSLPNKLVGIKILTSELTYEIYRDISTNYVVKVKSNLGGEYIVTVSVNDIERNCDIEVISRLIKCDRESLYSTHITRCIDDLKYLINKRESSEKMDVISNIIKGPGREGLLSDETKLNELREKIKVLDPYAIFVSEVEVDGTYTCQVMDKFFNVVLTIAI